MKVLFDIIDGDKKYHVMRAKPGMVYVMRYDFVGFECHHYPIPESEVRKRWAGKIVAVNARPQR